MAATRRLRVEARSPALAWSAMNAATVSRAAGVGVRARPAHHAVTVAKSDRYAGLVAADFSANA